jgi:23S rRNA (cytosine1962-C5)-methyltransferase
MERAMKALEEAWKRRQGLLAGFEEAGTDSYRLLSGDREGIPGLWADRYGPVVVLVEHEGASLLSDPERKEIALWYSRLPGVTSVYHKRFVPDRSRGSADAALFSPEPAAGVPAPEVFAIRENGLDYLVRPYDGFSTGIFLDQRENRRFLADLSANQRVLNAFSYTCAFSVAAAARGAKVTSVDVSRRYLEWGKENFELNDLSLEGQYFLARDVFRYLKGAAKKGETFEVVILDPPSFGRSKEGGVFSLRKDFGRLLSEAFPLVTPGGHFFFSCNLSDWDTAAIKAEAARVLGGSVSWEFAEVPPLAEDFRWEVHPLSSFLIRLRP